MSPRIALKLAASSAWPESEREDLQGALVAGLTCRLSFYLVKNVHAIDYMTKDCVFSCQYQGQLVYEL